MSVHQLQKRSAAELNATQSFWGADSWKDGLLICDRQARRFGLKGHSAATLVISKRKRPNMSAAILRAGGWPARIKVALPTKKMTGWMEITFALEDFILDNLGISFPSEQTDIPFYFRLTPKG